MGLCTDILVVRKTTHTSQILTDLEEAVDIMGSNIGKVIQRGEDLNKLKVQCGMLYIRK